MNFNRPLSESWYEVAQTWVDAEAAASALEDTKSSVFSQLCLRSGETAVARAEMSVRASEEWKAHLEKISHARTAANRAKIAMEFQRMRFMEWNNSEANHRMGAKL